MVSVTPMEAHSGLDPVLASPTFFYVTAGDHPASTCAEEGLEVLVVHTDTDGTMAALRMAGELARELAARIRLILPYEVPYALPLTRPPVSVEFLESRMRDLASRSNLDVAAQIYLCRNQRRALELLLKPHSLVVVGGRKHWWQTAAQRLAHALEEHGHQIIFAALR